MDHFTWFHSIAYQTLHWIHIFCFLWRHVTQQIAHTQCDSKNLFHTVQRQLATNEILCAYTCRGCSCVPCFRSERVLLSGRVLTTVTGCLKIDAVWRIGKTKLASWRMPGTVNNFSKQVWRTMLQREWVQMPSGWSSTSQIPDTSTSPVCKS